MSSTNTSTTIRADTFKSDLLKEKRELVREEVIRKSLLTFRTTSHPMLGGKYTAELLMVIMVRTISHTMIAKDKTNESTKGPKRGVCLLMISESVTPRRLKL